jgi:hypothetical protein
MIDAVGPGYPAEHAGLMPGDQVLLLNGEVVDSIAAFRCDDCVEGSCKVRRGSQEILIHFRKDERRTPLGVKLRNGTITDLTVISQLADAMRASSSLTAVNLLNNKLNVEVATMLAQISREKKITLCGIMADQTEADFNNRELGPADAILIAASLEFRSSLTKVHSIFIPFSCYSEPQMPPPAISARADQPGEKSPLWSRL